jgi:hypothetical protein
VVVEMVALPLMLMVWLPQQILEVVAVVVLLSLVMLL